MKPGSAVHRYRGRGGQDRGRGSAAGGRGGDGSYLLQCSAGGDVQVQPRIAVQVQAVAEVRPGQQVHRQGGGRDGTAGCGGRGGRGDGEAAGRV